ncbi:hypothetical protein [Dictyobacter arantiisoli]|uniref:Uncharacterized protein n=1 Tax=Dictyobacter arantiisoli TaxID=2014874 RepID=A0A5A5TGU4_9CHLR|nr:hypothetical protein [Dictyobacter arantiisoli]GCF10587.1 hypothetical protein KDI_41510 [Dictyobacter arantiisoli]
MERSSSIIPNEASSQTDTHAMTAVTRSSWSSVLRLLLVVSLAAGAILTTALGTTLSAYAATATETTAHTTPITSPPIVSGVDKAQQLLLKLAQQYPAPTTSAKKVRCSH